MVPHLPSPPLGLARSRRSRAASTVDRTDVRASTRAARATNRGSRISAPTLAVAAADDTLATLWQGRYTQAEYQERLQSVPHAVQAVVSDAGHMLHHDQPQQLARLIEEFLA